MLVNEGPDGDDAAEVCAFAPVAKLSPNVNANGVYPSVEWTTFDRVYSNVKRCPFYVWKCSICVDVRAEFSDRCQGADLSCVDPIWAFR